MMTKMLAQAMLAPVMLALVIQTVLTVILATKTLKVVETVAPALV